MTLYGVKRQILPATHDPLSAIHYLTQKDLSALKEIEMNINTNQKNYMLKGTVEQKELSLREKSYVLYVARAEIKRRDNNPYHKSSVSIVFLKDKENIPILIKIAASGIFINVKLVDIR
jgi:hypothetical protein